MTSCFVYVYIVLKADVQLRAEEVPLIRNLVAVCCVPQFRIEFEGPKLNTSLNPQV